jgi:DNA-binding transcriptional ArsR family regulator
MGMANTSESALRARASASWPPVSRRALGTLASHGSDRLNTPFRRTLVYLLARTRGGRNRWRILKLLHEAGPLNANQIASALHLHYTTVQHHLSKLLADDVIASNPRDDSYGALFFLTYQMERHAAFLDEILFALEPPEPAPSQAGFRPPQAGAVSQ